MRFFPSLFAALAAIAVGAPAFAGVGVTSSGVVTTDPNAPSTDVQQQSSGFVAANQQAQNTATNGGIAVPGAAAGSTGHGAASASASATANTQNANAANAAAHAAAPPVPPPPPPPPPTYESKMRPVARAPDPAPAPAIATPTATAPSVQKPVAANPKSADPAPVAAPKPQPAQAPAVVAPKVAQEVPLATDPGGGRGAAPEGYTFWFGLLIAGALLALAAVTWMKIQRGESPD